ncbi:hypothetical protein Agub_g8170, partial [Astrephomene gubernaculifera]
LQGRNQPRLVRCFSGAPSSSGVFRYGLAVVPLGASYSDPASRRRGGTPARVLHVQLQRPGGGPAPAAAPGEGEAGGGRGGGGSSGGDGSSGDGSSGEGSGGGGHLKCELASPRQWLLAQECRANWRDRMHVCEVAEGELEPSWRPYSAWEAAFRAASPSPSPPASPDSSGAASAPDASLATPPATPAAAVAAAGTPPAVAAAGGTQVQVGVAGATSGAAQPQGPPALHQAGT